MGKYGKKIEKKPQEYWDRLFKRSEVMSKMPVKQGMKFRLGEDNETSEAKAGDIVRVTSVRNSSPDGLESDYEVIRVSNGKFSWRVSRSDLEPLA